MHDAIGRHFLGSNGKLRPYKWSDFNYDVATGWIFLEVNSSDVSECWPAGSTYRTCKKSVKTS